MNNFISILILISAAVAIYSNYNNQRLHYLSKPLTTILIIILALINVNGNLYPMAIWIIGGLFLSLVGYIFLMFEESHFIKGLISFLIAHLFYIVAFSLGSGMSSTPLIFLPCLVISGISGRIIAEKAGEMKLPVFVYIIVISFMLWRAWEFYHFHYNSSALLIAVGASFFAVSDFILGFDKFRRRIPLSRLFILGTYYIAQYLIASSI